MAEARHRKALISLLLLTQVAFCWAARARTWRGDVDLRAFYAAGWMLRSGHANKLYEYAAVAQVQRQLFGAGQTLPFLYPVFAAIPFAALSWMSFHTVFVLLMLLDLACAAGAARLLTGCRGPGSMGILECGLLAIFPAAIALMQGQISFILLLLYAAMFALIRAERPMAAGLCLALALVKLQLALPVFLLYLIWRQWRVVSGFLLGATGLMAVSLSLTGLGGVQAYAGELTGVGARTLLQPAAAKLRYGMSVADMPNLHGLAAGLVSMPWLVAAATLTLSLAVLVWSARNQPSLALALSAALLVSYHLQPYDLLLLMVPAAITLQQRRSARATRLVYIAIAMLCAPVAPWVLVHGATRWFVFAVAAVWFATGMKTSAITRLKGIPQSLNQQHAQQHSL